MNVGDSDYMPPIELNSGDCSYFDHMNVSSRTLAPKISLTYP